MSETQATIRAEAQKLEQLITQTALDKSGADPPYVHSDVYFRVKEDCIETLVSAGGGSVLTYCTFEESYFDSLEGEAEGILEVEPTLERLAVAAGGDITELELQGPEDSRLVESLRAEGGLEMGVSLPASEKVLEKVPEEFPERWDDHNRFLSPSGNPHQTFIQTTVQTVSKIIEVVELDDSVDYYPLSVTDGEFSLDVGEGNDYFRGKLEASDVEGKDLLNWYGPGFEPAFSNTLSGGVELQTTPGEDGGKPLAAVQEDSDKTIRHVLVEVNPT